MKNPNNLYPLKFHDILKEKIWGGTNLAKVLSKKLPAKKLIGESWEISDHHQDSSIVKNGLHRGKNLRRLIQELDHRLLGDEVRRHWRRDRFPLLVKFIDAHDKLSIQVHPDDTYAARHEHGELGKTEAWYIVHAAPGAKLIIGVKKRVTRAQFKAGIKNNTLHKYVRAVPVKTGDTIFLAPGCLHAIMSGIIICEIQENSDLTYRVYDWGRLDSHGQPRPVHIQKSLDVVDLKYHPHPIVKPLEIREGKNRILYLAACRYFAIDKLMLKAPYRGNCDGRHFICLNIIEGKALLSAHNGTMNISQGESVLLPAYLGNYLITPQPVCQIIRSYIPDMDRDIFQPLLETGYTRQKIGRIVF